MDLRLKLAHGLLAIGALAGCHPPPASEAPVPEAAPEAAATDPDALAREAWSSFNDGDSTRALEGLELAAELYAAAGDEAEELETRVKAAMVISEVGAPERAIERYRRIFERLGGLDLSEVESLARIQVARSQTLTGDFAAAHVSLDRALAIYEQEDSDHGRVQVASGRAYTLMTEGRMAEAIAVGDEAVEASERLGLDDEAIRARAVVAYALQQTGDDDRAHELYLELRDQAWEKNHQRLLQFVYCNLAEIEWRRGNPRPAEGDLRATIAGLEAARAGSPATPEERAAFLGQQVAAYDRLIRLLADTYRGAEGFAVAERFHALSMLESLQEGDLDVAASDLPEL